MSTSLDNLFTRSLRTFETGGTICGHRTLSKTGRTGRPYAPVATVSLFTRIIELTVPRVSNFGIHLLKKGSEGSAYRISPKGEAVRLPTLIKWLGLPLRYEKQRIAILMQVTPTSSQTSGPKPRTDTSSRSFSVTHATKVTLPTPPLFRLNYTFKHYICKTLHPNASCRIMKRPSPHSI